MALRHLLGVTGLAVVAAVGLWVPGPATACAPAPPPGQSVEIADESAIILWDAATKTQHFIRRASFKTGARDFGFLVPTPTKPTLAEADDAAFDFLAKLTEPEVVTKTLPANSGCCTRSASKGQATAEPVRVLDEQRVAGYDAVVLEADDAGALGDWLVRHGYDFSAALKDWAAPYVKAGWKVTAFKIAKKAADAPDVSASAVRMTFQTERPFFPYREPAGQAAAEKEDTSRRLLRVYFLGEGRMKGTLGDKGNWPGTTVWANAVKEADRDELLRLLKLPGQTPPASWWLTEFEDASSPRPGTEDVYFAAADDQAPVARPPQVQYVSAAGPGCVMCCTLVAYLAGSYLVRHRPRRRAAAA